MSKEFLPINPADISWHQGVPFSNQYNDVYHSTHSGIGQSRHVFIEGNDLIQRWSTFNTHAKECFYIGETGFGTGLNFLLTWHLWQQYAPNNACLHFISCDKHPLKLDDLIKYLNNWPELKGEAEQLIEKYPVLTPGYHHLSFNEGKVKLTLMLGDAFECYEQLLICGSSILETHLRAAFIDAWYLDGFSPSKNEAMWSSSLIQAIAMLSKKGTTLATYSAASVTKTSLQNYGFVIEKKKGYGPKRHMIAARLEHIIGSQLKSRQTAWHVDHPIINTEKTAIIIGAGLAGCFTAFSLAKRGWSVTLIDELNSPGQAGSGNQQAVLFPKLSAYQSPLTEFMLTAFLYSYALYKGILAQVPLGELNGSLLVAFNEKEKKAHDSLSKWLLAYPELGQLVDAATASQIAGIPLYKPGLFIPLSGWINSVKLCDFLIDDKNISFMGNTRIDELNFNKGYWNINGKSAPILILANGQKINSFIETHYLPIKAIRGQMTQIKATSDSIKLKIPLCGEGHVLPEFNDAHFIGATYELGVSNAATYERDDQLNITKIINFVPEVNWSQTVINQWSGVRASTPDYLPLVGPIAKEYEFLHLFSSLESNAKRWIPNPGPYYQGLYACSGFGSRGITTIPLCAEFLAASINNEMNCLPRHLIHALSPSRFLRRKITRGLG